MSLSKSNGYTSGKNSTDVTVSETSKLSKLQKWILSEAAKKDRLYFTEIKIGYYGFQTKTYFWSDERKTFDGPTGQYFSVADNPNYRTASAAISRAVTRLERRGLITVLVGQRRHWTAVQLPRKVMNPPRDAA